MRKDQVGYKVQNKHDILRNSISLFWNTDFEKSSVSYYNQCKNYIRFIFKKDLYIYICYEKIQNIYLIYSFLCKNLFKINDKFSF